ncbi:hypothetical protein P175DRAFT_0405457, partial [Aspergillus ochraceoroseus IBT 24754]
MASTKVSDLSSKRRRFQPPITTFFSTTSDPNTSSSASHLSYTHYSAATHSPTPVVPAKVQASLLSVGMRVRKSVAEGYKTQPTKTIEDLPITHGARTLQATPTTTPSYRNPHSELAPFCGISKSGDYPGVQSLSPQPPTSLPYSNAPVARYNRHITTDDADSFSLPPSSQESIDSHSTAQKRSYDLDCSEDEEELGEIKPALPGAGTPWGDPLRLNPVTTHSASLVSGRTILPPKLGRHRSHFLAAQKQRTEMNFGDADFDEPAFLRRREEVD